MNVLLLTNSSGWGGTEVHTLGLVNTLAERGHAVTVLTLGYDLGQDARWNPTGPVHLCRVRLPRTWKGLGWTSWFRLLAGFQADVALFAKGSVREGSFALDLAARWRFPRYLTLEHSAGQPSSARGKSTRLPDLSRYAQLGRCYSRSLNPHRVLCVSQAVRDRLTREYRFPARKVVTIANGIDPVRFRPDPALRQATRRAWAIPSEALVFGLLGRLSAEKGCDVAVELFQQLLAGRPGSDLRLVLVGDGPEAAPLRQAVAASNLQERVVFTGPTAKPWEAYPAFDVLLMPSRFEGLPLALLEAMACGCCPLAMGVGGIPEVLTDPSLGWLVAPGDRPAFLAALREAAASSPAELRAKGRRAREHVQSHFNARAQFAALAAYIEGTEEKN